MRLDNRKYLGTCLENCVHVAGILNFFRIANEVGYETKFLGPANSIGLKYISFSVDVKPDQNS